MISNENLNKIIKDCESAGYTIKVKDISYILLCRCYDDIAVAYKVIFNNDKTNAEILDYHKSNAIEFLRNYLDINFKDEKKEVEIAKPKRKKAKGEDITFEENKAEMIKLIKQADDRYANGEIDAKDHLKIVTELRVKLNDKFQVKEEMKEQLVIVNQKYNAICDGCGRETYIPTKEDLMKQYNLIENGND